MRVGGRKLNSGKHRQPPATARNCPMGSPTVNLCSESGNLGAGNLGSGNLGSRDLGIWASGNLAAGGLGDRKFVFDEWIAQFRGNPTFKFKSKSQNGDFWMLIGDDDW